MDACTSNDADKTDCIKNKYKFQCTDGIIAVLNTAFKKGESIWPNIKHFTVEFDLDDVNNDAHDMAWLILQSSSDVIIVSSLDDCSTNDTILCVSLFETCTSNSIVKCLIFGDILIQLF